MKRTLKEGIMKLRKLIYNKRIFLLYHKARDVKIEARVDIRRIDGNNVNDGLSFNEEKYIKLFKDFILRGDRGYYGYLNDECVHRSWVRTGAKEIELIKGFNLNLSDNEAYIHYCSTAEKARGRNIYPFVLNYIVNELKQENIINIYMLVLETKKSAMRGVEKAGFEKCKRIKSISVLGANFIKEE